MRRKRQKLQIQNAQLVEDFDHKPAIFKGVAIWVNGRTIPSAVTLRELILDHGGTYHDHMDRKSMITHIIASNLTPAKWRELQHMKVVKPEWMVQSVEAGRLLPWRGFRLQPNAGHDEAQGVAAGSSPASASRITRRAVNPFATPAPPPAKAADDQHAALIDPMSENDTSVYLVETAEPVPQQSAARSESPEYMTDPVTLHEAMRMPGYAPFKTNETAARMMSDPAWRAQNTSRSDDFIDNYYKQSRLHHLSMWKAQLRDLVAKAQTDAEVTASSEPPSGTTPRGVSMRGAQLGGFGSLKSPIKSAHAARRVILHCDFDCFFVSAGLVTRPELKGKPVVVCHSLGKEMIEISTSEIASSSYEARAFGVRNGMSLSQAYKLCNDIQAIPYEFESYKRFALQFYTILMRNCDDLEAVSVDEALLDVSSCLIDYEDSDEDPARAFGLRIQNEVRDATGCTISIGISENVLLARLATRRAKPGGVYHLLRADAQDHMKDLKVTDLRGFAHNARQKLEAKFGADGAMIREVVKHSEGVLSTLLGPKTGSKLYKAVRGIDGTPLQSDKPRKSVSAEVNYGIRFQDNEEFRKFLDQLSDEVSRRLRDVQMRGRQLTLKLMTRHPDAPVEAPKFLGHGICNVHSRSTQLDRLTDESARISSAAWKVAEEFKFDPKELRGIGLQMQKLECDEVLARQRKDAQRGSIKSAFTRQKHQHQHQTVEDDMFNAPGLPASASAAAAAASMSFDMPTFSQIDKSVLDQLPEEIQRELRSEWEKHSSRQIAGGSRAGSAQPPACPSREKSLPLMVEETSGAGPSRLAMNAPLARSRSTTPIGMTTPTKSKAPDVRHITKQLAPRNMGVSPTKQDGGKLASIFARAAKQAEVPVSVPIEKLRRLGIDPDVFYALPKSDQREQLRSMEQAHKEQRYQRSPVKHRHAVADAAAQRFTRSPSVGARPRARVRPRGIAPVVAVREKEPSIRQRLARSKEIVHIKSMEEVQRLIGTWVDAAVATGKPPDQKTDVPVFAKYLVACVQQDQAVERAASVMRWWRLRIERLAVAPTFQNNKVSVDAWWVAFNSVLKVMNDEMVNRHGCSLHL
ncbi:hypothetical protein BKA62DRAFT_364397 [Auriculariales sp. MPI-PUGE-AT-0066]|nr:hypothetical protein BKA62DRAFT_364397 [Auriculariales sp. MPI-PUGE-AT-0066]